MGSCRAPAVWAPTRQAVNTQAAQSEGFVLRRQIRASPHAPGAALKPGTSRLGI